jgi:hypothetical protein
MVKSNFIDIDAIISIDSQAWVVDKNNPTVPILKISKSDFNLIRSGIYHKQNNKMEFNGQVFWLPTELVNSIKIKSKIYRVDFSNLAISLREFLDKDIIDSMESNINLDIIQSLVDGDTYIICSKQTKKNYQSIIDRLEKKLKENGCDIKNFYYISENFYNQKKDDINFKKMRLLLQHLVGYRTDGDKFIDEEVTRYDQLYYYDNNYDTLRFTDDINGLLDVILTNTESGVRSVIKEDIVDYRPRLIVNKVNDNKFNKIETKSVIIGLSSFIKNFESFKRGY